MLDWQTIVSLIIVAVASAALLKRLVPWWQGNASVSRGCGSCPGKSSASHGRIKELPLVSLEPGKTLKPLEK